MYAKVEDRIEIVCSTHTVTTCSTGWQQRCRELAETRSPFELQEIRTQHFMFCFELCAEYDFHFEYTYAAGQSVARFKPIKRSVWAFAETGRSLPLVGFQR